MCRCHFDLLEKNQHGNGTAQSPAHSIGTFRAATQRIHNAIVDEFGDRSISTETSNTGITSSDAVELEDRSEHNDLDDFPWAGRSFNTPAMSQISCKLYLLSHVSLMWEVVAL